LRRYTCSKHTNDPKTTPWKINVQTSEGRDAAALNLKDIVGALERERLSTEPKGELRKAREFGTINSVLSTPILFGANLSVEYLGHIGRESNERGT